MTSEVEERPRLVTAGYGQHGSQWAKFIFIISVFIFWFKWIIKIKGTNSNLSRSVVYTHMWVCPSSIQLCPLSVQTCSPSIHCWLCNDTLIRWLRTWSTVTVHIYKSLPGWSRSECFGILLCPSRFVHWLSRYVHCPSILSTMQWDIQKRFLIMI